MTPVSLDEIGAALRRDFEGRVESEYPIAKLTTYRLGGPAALYVEPAGTADVTVLGRVLRDLGAPDAVPVLSLGRGSNIVVSDRGWPGVVVRLSPAAFSWIEPLAEGTGLVAGGSTSLPLLANWAGRRALTGLEFLVAIPGSVGGAVTMNAGAHGREISDCLISARVFDIDLLQTDVRPAAALSLSYRSSNLTPRHLVLDAAFDLEPSVARVVRERMEMYRRHRSETQPGAVQNAGSVFVNPPGDHAGRLVEAAGLKGFRVGGAAVSELHANFFVSDETATAQDVYDLVRTVAERVRAVFGVELTPEVRFVGEFDDSAEVRG